MDPTKELEKNAKTIEETEAEIKDVKARIKELEKIEPQDEKTEKSIQQLKDEKKRLEEKEKQLRDKENILLELLKNEKKEKAATAESSSQAKRQKTDRESLSNFFYAQLPEDTTHWLFNMNKETPFFYVEQWINGPLVQKIRLSEASYREMIDNFPELKKMPEFVQNFESGTPAIDHDLENWIYGRCTQIKFNRLSENANIWHYDILFRYLIDKFASVMMLTTTRDKKETKTNSTVPGKRPDFLCYLYDCLVLNGEEKVPANGGMVAAVEAVSNKMGPTGDEFYANIPFIFAYAASNQEFQMFSICRGSVNNRMLIPLFILNLATLTGRIQLIIRTIKLLCIFKQYELMLGSSSTLPFKLFVWQDLGRLTTKFRFGEDVVEKLIMNPPPGTTIKQIQQVYQFLHSSNNLANGGRNVIRCIKVSSSKDQSELKQLGSVTDSLTVKLMPACYHRKVISSLCEFAQCLIDITSGLNFLHLNCVIHRDLRWSNVLYDKLSDCYLIIDLDHSIKMDPDQQFSVVSKDFRNQLPIEYMTRSGDGFKFTRATDMVSLGFMIQEAITGAVVSYGAMLNINISNILRTNKTGTRWLNWLVNSCKRGRDQPSARQLHDMLKELKPILEFIESDKARDEIDAEMNQYIDKLTTTNYDQALKELKEIKLNKFYLS